MTSALHATHVNGSLPELATFFAKHKISVAPVWGDPHNVAPINTQKLARRKATLRLKGRNEAEAAF